MRIPADPDRHHGHSTPSPNHSNQDRRPAAANGASHRAASRCARFPSSRRRYRRYPPAPCPKPLYTITHVPREAGERLASRVRASGRPSRSTRSRELLLDYVDTKRHRASSPSRTSGTRSTTAAICWTAQVDSSVDHGEPIGHLRRAARHPGLDTGFAGMRVGGRRACHVPYRARLRGERPTAHPSEGRADLRRRD